MMNVIACLQGIFVTDSARIDNNIFRLHYKATIWILVLFSIYVKCTQFFDGSITCITKDDIPERFLDSFSYIHATFSLVDSWEKTVGNEVPYPGVDKYGYGERRVYHAYYQWVSTVLFIQAVLFYIPRYFWKAWEGGRIKKLVLGLTSNLSEDIKCDKRNHIIEYMLLNMHNQNFYFWSYVLAEVMNFANVVGQIFLVDAFLGGQFLSYGLEVVQFNDWSPSVKYDPMIKVFPRMAKSTFHRYGSSGDVQRHDAMCILPTNMVNEKIYLFLWFWFIILSVLSGLALVYRAVIIFWPKSRLMVIRLRVRLDNQDFLDTLISRFKLGDWFLLDLLSKNLDSLDFRDVINRLARRQMNDVLASS